jgi:hypothetical protein
VALLSYLPLFVKLALKVSFTQYPLGVLLRHEGQNFVVAQHIASLQCVLSGLVCCLFIQISCSSTTDLLLVRFLTLTLPDVGGVLMQSAPRAVAVLSLLPPKQEFAHSAHSLKHAWL